MTTRDLVSSWLAAAVVLREHGAGLQADLTEKHARELEAALASGEAEGLTLKEASAASGYSVAHLRRMIAEGALRNVAKDSRPLVRRGDLPRKPGHHLSLPRAS